MENNILHYLSKRIEGEKAFTEPGPIITISREYGCYASQIAEKLCSRLNQILVSKDKKPLWKWISKEILEKAAEDLKQHPSNISHIFGAEEKPMLGDLIISFSNKSYTSDSKIKKTIIDVVKRYAENGNVIIVGRAGCVITKDFQKTFHIKLFAPIEWRIEQIQKRFQITAEEAKQKVLTNDQHRATFMGFFRGNIPDSQLFDMTFNRATIPEDIIIDSILNVLELNKYRHS